LGKAFMRRPCLSATKRGEGGEKNNWSYYRQEDRERRTELRDSRI